MEQLKAAYLAEEERDRLQDLEKRLKEERETLDEEKYVGTVDPHSTFPGTSCN